MADLAASLTASVQLQEKPDADVPFFMMSPAVSAPLKTKVDVIVPAIEKIMQKCKDQPAGHTQPAVDKIVDMCLSADLAYKKRVMGRNCGIHPANRARTGVDPINAQNLALKMSLQGYSESKLENPMGFEKSLDGPTRDEQEAFMARNFVVSNGFLKKIEPRDADYLPVCCSHTHAALNIISGGVSGLHPEMCDKDGRTDLQKVLQLCPSWKKPIEEGIPCVVFRHEVEAACPTLPAFLSKAGNQSHDVHAKETTVQLMLSLSQLYVAQKRAAASASLQAEAANPWDAIVAEIEVMKPHFAGQAAEAAAFVEKWSGGDDAPSLVEVETYAKSLKVRREPEFGQLGILAKATLARAPAWPIACLKALLQAPEFLFTVERRRGCLLLQMSRRWRGNCCHNFWKRQLS